ncbi:hypothetical protein ACFFLM_04070 [Deinococcus oregonensis]|uniref:Uncharacterized protein n=1 Tax=Deinococcus oregonensis TaxID=1805970 RepID=A0ABV6AY55_9DEIO
MKLLYVTSHAGSWISQAQIETIYVTREISLATWRVVARTVSGVDYTVSDSYESAEEAQLEMQKVINKLQND